MNDQEKISKRLENIKDAPSALKTGAKVDSIDDMSDEHLFCRLNHLYDWVADLNIETVDGQIIQWERLFACIRCGAKKVETLDSDFRVIKRDYDLPPGYVLKKGRLTKPEVRAEQLKRMSKRTLSNTKIKEIPNDSDNGRAAGALELPSGESGAGAAQDRSDEGQPSEVPVSEVQSDVSLGEGGDSDGYEYRPVPVPGQRRHAVRDDSDWHPEDWG